MGVQARVYSRLHWDKDLNDSTIELEFKDGVAILHGTVKSLVAKAKAVGWPVTPSASIASMITDDRARRPGRGATARGKDQELMRRPGRRDETGRTPRRGADPFHPDRRIDRASIRRGGPHPGSAANRWIQLTTELTTPASSRPASVRP